ncbi:Cytochrome c4 [bacterium HR39]|nr:Cytochrome c4 [bacterium HR39]
MKRILPVLAVWTLAVVLPARAQQVDIEQLAETCRGCHGDSENLPVDPTYPIIAGQEFYYLYVQLRDFKSGLRENETMQGVVADLDRETLKAIAQYWSEKPWPKTNFPAPSEKDVRLAEQAVTSAECTACHLGDFRGSSRVPRLKNQQPGYLEKTMKDMKEQRRRNSPNMMALFKTFPDEWIEALARYLAAL